MVPVAAPTDDGWNKPGSQRPYPGCVLRCPVYGGHGWRSVALVQLRNVVLPGSSARARSPKMSVKLRSRPIDVPNRQPVLVGAAAEAQAANALPVQPWSIDPVMLAGSAPTRPLLYAIANHVNAE